MGGLPKAPAQSARGQRALTQYISTYVDGYRCAAFPFVPHLEPTKPPIPSQHNRYTWVAPNAERRTAAKPTQVVYPLQKNQFRQTLPVQTTNLSRITCAYSAMKKFVLSLGLAVATLSMNAQSTITGVWNMGKENTLLDIKEVGGVSTGTVVSSDKAELLGKQMLKEVKLVGHEWKGQLYVPRLGKWAAVTITRPDGNKLRVAVSAGIGSRTVGWVKQ